MEVEILPGPSKTLAPATRHRCAACFHQFKIKEHLIAHMKTSYHSPHQPKCSVCQKHCKVFESLREHLYGPIAKPNCSIIFGEKGCNLCLKVFESASSLTEHKEVCALPAPAPLGTINLSVTEFQASDDGNIIVKGLEAVAMDCELVGGGSDGTLDLCARVCLVDEEEKLIFHTYVQPPIAVTNYRYEVTGLTEEHLRDAMPLKEVVDKILQILYNGESIGKVRLDGGKARLLVGHNVEHDLGCLRMNYPDKLLRDTSTYRPLAKTNLAKQPLKYLTKTYLGYDIQLGTHDPYEDCVSVMRLYKRMRSQDHQVGGIGTSCAYDTQQSFVNAFDSWKFEILEKMTPQELFEISRSNYRCWCMDSKQACRHGEGMYGA